MDILTLIATCAPLISPGLMAGIVDVASQGQPLAIYRHDTRESIHPATEAEAVATARRLLAANVEISGGLAQLDSKVWTAFNLTAENVFSPCANLGAAEDALITWYTKDVGDLDAALSRFQTGGDPVEGIKSGYVGKVKEAAKRAASLGDAKGGGDPQSTSAAKEGSVPSEKFSEVLEGFKGGR